MKNKRWLIILVVAISAVSFAKEKRARSYDVFYDQLAKSPYTVVLLYDKSKENMKNKQLKEEIKELELMFRSVSKDPEYTDANLLFLIADVAQRDLYAVGRSLAINEYPAIQLFIGRQPINGATLYGTIERQQLHNLINRFLRKNIDEYLKDKDAARKRALEQAKIRAYNRAYYWGPYYGYYGYPYWGWRGYPYWGYGPRYGFYAGW